MKIEIEYEYELTDQELILHREFTAQQKALGNEVFEIGGGTKNPRPKVD